MNEGMWIDICGNLYRFIWTGQDYRAISEKGWDGHQHSLKDLTRLIGYGSWQLQARPDNADFAWKERS